MRSYHIHLTPHIALKTNIFEGGYYDMTPKGAYMELNVYDMTPKGPYIGLTKLST
jgi:hypothetical protein